MMKLNRRILFSFLAIALVTTVNASAAQNDEQKAVLAFRMAQINDTGELNLVRAKTALMSSGFTQEGLTRAALLSGRCSFSGCDYTWFVTTIFSTPGTNPSISSISGLVQTKARAEQGLFVKLSRP